MRIFIFVCAAMCAWAQLTQPGIGMMLDAEGRVRPVSGVAGSMTVGDAVALGVLSTACSARLCLSKTASSIVSPASEVAAPPGPAMFAFDANAAFVYFPEAGSLARWHGGRLDPIEFDPGGEVLALRARGGVLEFAVKRDDGVWIVRGGALVDSLPADASPVALLDDGALYQSAGALVLRREDRTEIHFDADAVDALSPMGAGWVQASHYAIRVERGREQLVLLPDATGPPFGLYTFDGTTETPVGAIYDYGNVAVGDTKEVRFRFRNNGAAAIVLTSYPVSGSGFSLYGAPTPPYTVAPGNFLDLRIRFQANSPAAYSASFSINTINVILLATAVPGVQLSATSGCTLTSGTIDFGSVPAGVTKTCNLSLQNPSAQPVAISNLAVSGSFQMTPAAPFTLGAGEAVPFSIQATPACGANTLSGTLSVNNQNYSLTLSSFLPALPRAVASLDSATIASGEQHQLSMNLASAAPCGGDGNVTLSFTPNGGLNDDQTILFVALGTRTIPFHVNPGSAQVLLNGRAAVVFATGSTAGTITFAIAGANAGSVTIAPTTIAISSATASNQRLGNLDISVTGFDNTYSAGQMSFTFFDAAGKSYGPMDADFRADFSTYFAAQKAGSSFLMRVSFPITGDQTAITGVNLSMTNAAGRIETGTLTFQ